MPAPANTNIVVACISLIDFFSSWLRTESELERAVARAARVERLATILQRTCSVAGLAVEFLCYQQLFCRYCLGRYRCNALTAYRHLWSSVRSSLARNR
jgi:hypothetical protein